MKKIFKVIKSPKFFIPFIIIVIILGIIFFNHKSSGDSSLETQKVQKQTVTQIVSETGIVEPAQDVTLGFEQGGRVTRLTVVSGDHVIKGQVLGTVDSSSQKATLLSAQAQLKAQQAQLTGLTAGNQAGVASGETSVQNAEANLEKVTSQENQMVQNAHGLLYSSNLEAYLVEGDTGDKTVSYVQPTISGNYSGTTTGSYRIELYPSNSDSGYSFTYSGIESGIGTISTVQPQILGKQGLYIQFPSNFARGSDIVYSIPVPNTRSSYYISSNNSYQSALKGREAALTQAQAGLNSAKAGLNQTTAQEGQTYNGMSTQQAAQEAAVLGAQASVNAAQSTLSKTILTAPFDGIVSNVSVSESEIVGAGTPALSLISNSNYQLKIYIPESDITNIDVGDTATVSFDPYPGVAFTAEVTAIAPQALVQDGVRSFETTLTFNENDPRIRAGLSADVDVNAAEAIDVFAIPARAVEEKNGKEYTRVIDTAGAQKEVPITTGLRGSNGLVEITSGLSLGDVVVTFSDSFLSNS